MMPAGSAARVLGYKVGLLPNLFQLYSPLKICEFETALIRLRPVRPATVIDVCCGTGIQAQLIALSGSRVVGIDHDLSKIKDALWHLKHSRVRDRVSFVTARAEDIPLPSESADAALCLCAVEHLASPGDALREVVRVLKPGARLCMTADSLANVADERLKARHRSLYGVYRYFDVDTLSGELCDAGFDVEDVFPMLRSQLAVHELERCMNDPSPLSPLKAQCLVRRLRKRDEEAAKLEPGLFIFALATKRA